MGSVWQYSRILTSGGLRTTFTHYIYIYPRQESTLLTREFRTTRVMSLIPCPFTHFINHKVKICSCEQSLVCLVHIKQSKRTFSDVFLLTHFVLWISCENPKRAKQTTANIYVCIRTLDFIFAQKHSNFNLNSPFSFLPYIWLRILNDIFVNI